MPISRREFLKALAITSAIGAVSPLHRLYATEDTVTNHLQSYLDALDAPFDAPLNDHFTNVIYGDPVGLILYDITNTRLLTAISSERMLPVASAFKAPLFMYFLDVVPSDVWGTIPVAHWNATSASEVPEQYRNAWTDHRLILRAVWQTIVMSNNPLTGEVLSYIASEQGRTDAIVAFNDWSENRVGISQLSGLSAWQDGVRSGMTFTDARFLERETAINSQLVPFDNMFTARDLGMYYMWMLTHFTEQQQTICKTLLSTIHNNRGANLERLAQEHTGVSYSKNGSLETDAGYVVTDAGIIELPNNQLYLLVMQSVDPFDEYASVVPNLFQELSYTLGGTYNDIVHRHQYGAVTPNELLATYTAHLNSAYPQQTHTLTGDYRYGFIMPEGIQVYDQPSDDSTLHNPIIKATRFGVHLLMQGALVRFVDVDDQWVRLMPDDDRDNVRVRLGSPLYVKRSDVWEVSLDHAQPIDYIADPTTTAEDKIVVIDVVGSELIAVEGATPVIRVPIVLNADTTPRGAQIITSKWFSRSMQPWAPGVPFTAFFGAEGFALHGSPWQRWSSTVNQNNIAGRTSAGCVNVPDWMITSGDYTRPADELLFRWVGGMEDAESLVFNYPTSEYPAIRIFSVDYLPNLNNYYRPDGMYNRGIAWDDLINAVETMPLQAPQSFFV